MTSANASSLFDDLALVQVNQVLHKFKSPLAKASHGLATLQPGNESIPLPINSAGQHEGAQKIVDLVLLIICLLVPFVIYGIINLVQRFRSPKAEEGARTKGVREPARIGSTYDFNAGDGGPLSRAMSDTARGLKLTSALAPSQDDEDEDADQHQGTPLSNALAGFSTAMAALPDAISFSFITGVSPLNGIWAGVFMGLSAALVGGRPGMISSASAATAVVLAKISTDPAYGMGPMALCVFIVGVLQIIAGCLRLSRFITLIPHPVMIGFVNGLAIVMIKAQMRQFHYNGDGPWVEGDIILGMVITALFSMLAAITWARIPYASKILPAPLASVIMTTIFSKILMLVLPARTLGDVAGAHTFSGGFSVLPSWDFPPVGVEYSGTVLMQVFTIAVRFAIVGLLESLMTEALIDQITSTRSSMRRECFGQGVGNILASFFGTQGGCALIAQSLMNVGSGGRTRVSGVVMGITLALCVVVLAPLMALIPVAALVGLICLIALNTFAWGSLMLILRINLIDATVVVVVTVVTVLEDLCIAVVYGVIISALGFAWHAATDVQVDEDHDDVTGERTFSLRGPLFFGSAMNYQQYVTRAKVPEQLLVLDFTHSRILDISAADAIGKARDYWEEQGKEVRLAGIPEDAMSDIPASNKQAK